MRRSQASASSHPPPSAKPDTAAITHRGMAADRVERPEEGAAPTTRASSGPPNSLMSAPAANSRSPPVTTTAPGGSSVSACGRGLELAAAARSTGR